MSDDRKRALSALTAAAEAARTTDEVATPSASSGKEKAPADDDAAAAAAAAGGGGEEDAAAATANEEVGALSAASAAAKEAKPKGRPKGSGNKGKPPAPPKENATGKLIPSKAAFVEVHEKVRALIAASPPGALKPMSAALMADELVQNGNISEHAAKGLYSQIRKHAPLHAEWHAAFTEGRFKQLSGGFLPKAGQAASTTVRKPALAKPATAYPDRWTATVGNQFVDTADNGACYLITELRGGWCGAVVAATGQPSDNPAQQWWGAAALEQRATAKAHASKKKRSAAAAPQSVAEAAPAAPDAPGAPNAAPDAAPDAAPAVTVPLSPATKMRRIATFSV